MKWKEFLKPDQKKTTFFILLFLLIPFPLLIFYTHPPFFFDLSSHFFPLTAPLAFIFAILSLVEWLEQGGFSLLDIVVFVIAPLLYPFVLYLISCRVTAFMEKA